MTWLLKNLALPIVGQIATGACVLLLVALVTARCTIADLEGQVETAQKALQTEQNNHAATRLRCEENRTMLEAAIKEQNDKFASLQAQGAADTARANAALARARNEAVRLNGEAVALLNRPTPADHVCEAALSLVRE